MFFPFNSKFVKNWEGRTKWDEWQPYTYVILWPHHPPRAINYVGLISIWQIIQIPFIRFCCCALRSCRAFPSFCLTRGRPPNYILYPSGHHPHRPSCLFDVLYKPTKLLNSMVDLKFLLDHKLTKEGEGQDSPKDTRYPCGKWPGGGTPVR